jgi:TonB-linked SusC/RagA family outer membrane protein
MKKKLLFLFMLLGIFQLAWSQERKVSGKVSAASDGSSLPGITVRIQGSSVVTQTDANGDFSISAQSGDVLQFTGVGYKTVTRAISSQTILTISMEDEDSVLDEVVVVAYGTAKKGTFTGSASVLNADKIKDNPVTSFENNLIGRIAGAQVTQASGQAGSTPTIRIRGIGSMNASNDPLYVIDGVPVVSGGGGQLGDYILRSNNIMASINPGDIESITVLKDAAAASLYGSRAANGVVVITTKKGKTGKPSVNLKSSVGFTPGWATDNYETAGVQEQINMLYQVFHDLNTSAGRDDAYASSNAITRLNTRFAPHGYEFSATGAGRLDNVIIKGKTDGVENRDGRYFDWEDALFRTGVYNTNEVSVNGGNDATKYYTSLSYTLDQNRIKVNNFDRIGGRLNLTQKIGRVAEIGSNINISRNTLEGFNDTRNTGSNYFMQVRNLLWPIYWPTDYKTGLPFTARFGSLAQNNLYHDKEWENSSITQRLSAVESLSLFLMKGLTFKTVFSYDNTSVKDHLYYSANHWNAQTTRGAVHEMTTSYNKILTSNTLNYATTFANKHDIGLLFGFEAEKNETDFMRSSGTDLPSSALHTVATAGTTNASAYSWGYNMMSFFSRAEYNYDQKYYASASFRRDGSSRLGPETRWGNFWSVAGSWRISREEFLRDNDVISNLRLRASYGTNGTLPSNNFGWRSLIGYGNKYMEQAGGGITTIADRNLTWETSYSTNIALEFGLFKNRLNGSVEYFNRDSKDLLQDVPISTVTGFSSTLKNVGEINNKGIEIELNGDIIRNNNFRWSAGLNATTLKSKVTKLYGGQPIIWNDPTGGDARSQFIYQEGESTLAFYGYEWAGVDPENGKNVWYMNSADGDHVGDFQFNGRGATYSYTKATRKIIGDATPKLFGGFQTDLEYKGFSLDLNFIYKLGGNLYDGAFKDVADDGYYWERIRAQEYYDNMWTPANTNGSLPKIDGNDLTDAMQHSTRQMHSASFVRLKNLTLAYRIPKQVLQNLKIENCRVYFNGTNLWTASKFKIADPEVNQYGTRGWETPFGKTYTFGIELGF